MIIPLQWIGLFAVAVVFVIMFAPGLMLGREQIAAALAVLVVKLFHPSHDVAAGIILMAISPGAPVALRRALDAGGDRRFAPALHLAIVLLAVLRFLGAFSSSTGSSVRNSQQRWALPTHFIGTNSAPRRISTKT